MKTVNILMELFNNILRGIVAINDCFGLACNQTIKFCKVGHLAGYHQPQFRLQVAV